MFEGENGIKFNFSKNLNLTNCYRQKEWSTADFLFAKYSFCFVLFGFVWFGFVCEFVSFEQIHFIGISSLLVIFVCEKDKFVVLSWIRKVVISVMKILNNFEIFRVCAKNHWKVSLD